jgi:uncharacterized integral membrane protein
MKRLLPLLTCLILGIWVSSIALFSVQNATLVSLKFVGRETIEIPIGVILGISVGIGAIAGASLELFSNVSKGQRETVKRTSKENQETLYSSQEGEW